MDRSEIVGALEALGEELHRRGVTGEMYIVGGAAIALAYDERRSTRDLGALFEAEGGDLRGRGGGRGAPRSPGWLSDAVNGLLAEDDREAAPVLDVPGLRCLAASPRMLLALKVLAHRVGEDEDDVRLLVRKLDLGSPSEVLSVAEHVFGDRLETAARFFVEELFAGR